MKSFFSFVGAFCLAVLLHGVSLAQDSAPQKAPPAGVPIRRFEPPPVPQFMLRPPEKPLSREEMIRQADEAAARVRERPAAPDARSDSAPRDAAAESVK